MKHAAKRVLALLLALTLVAAMVPLGASAAPQDAENAVIPEERLNFQCEDAEETGDRDLNTEGKGQLTDGFPAGEISENAPEPLEKGGHRHVFTRATVAGVEVYNVGVRKIGNDTYYYYTTEKDPAENATYSVLAKDVDENAKPTEDAARITLYYSHDAGADLKYQFVDENGTQITAPEGVSLESIFQNAPKNTDKTGAADITLKIPEDYTAEVSVKNNNDQTVNLYFPDEQEGDDSATGYESVKLGVMQEYTIKQDGTVEQTSPDTDAGEITAREATVHIAEVTDAAQTGPLVVSVNLTKHETYTFSAENWLDTRYAADRFSLSVDNVEYKETDTITPSTDETDPDFTWKIQGISKGGTTWELDRLEINGEAIEVPFVVVNGKHEEPEITTLSSGTEISLHVAVEGDTLGTDVVRTYTLEVYNCHEDLTITGGNFVSHTHKELVVTDLEGVTGEAWVLNNQAIPPVWNWYELTGGQRLLQRTENYSHANDPLRFESQLGYFPPHVTVKAKDGTELQYDDKSGEKNDQEYLNGDLAVELLILDENANEGNLAKDDTDQNQIADTNFKANGDGTGNYSHSYTAWSTQYQAEYTGFKDGTIGNYYIRGTDALQSYMTDQDTTHGVVRLEITAEPIPIKLEYKSGASTDGTDAPEADEITMPEVDENATYNIKDKATLIMADEPTDKNGHYVFDGWELLALNDAGTAAGDKVYQVENAEGTYVDYVLSAGETGSVALALKTGQYYWKTGNGDDHSQFADEKDTAVFTLRAKWKEATPGTNMNYDVNYYVLNSEDEADTATPVYTKTMWAPVGGTVIADLYADAAKTEFCETVKQVLKGTLHNGEGESPDYTEGGKEYILGKDSKTEIVSLGKDNNTLNIYLVWDAHTVTFLPGSNGTLTGTTSIPVSNGATLPEGSIPTVTANSGYTFSGTWTDGSKTYTAEQILALSITGDMTFTAMYTKNSTPVIPRPDPTPTPTPPSDPDDTGVSGWLNTTDHIQYLYGYPDRTFGPGLSMTRAEVAQMFYNLLLEPQVELTAAFEDVPQDAWYTQAVNTLASLGVVTGVGNGLYEPERPITRAEFTSIAMKFTSGSLEGENIFTDVQPSAWYYNAVVGSIQYGWIHGYGDGTFRPDNDITRAEVTAIVNQMLGRFADQSFVDAHLDELNNFTDIQDETYWAYYHIREATNQHDYTCPASQKETWLSLRYDLT